LRGGAQFRHSDKAITALWDRFDEAGQFCRVPQGVPKPLDGIVQPLIEIHEGVCSPDPLPKLFSGYQFARMSQENLQKLERLVLEFDPDPSFAQFPTTQIHFEDAEANCSTQRMRTLHVDHDQNRTVVYHRLRTERPITPVLTCHWQVRRRSPRGWADESSALLTELGQQVQKDGAMFASSFRGK